MHVTVGPHALWGCTLQGAWARFRGGVAGGAAYVISNRNTALGGLADQAAATCALVADLAGAL